MVSILRLSCPSTGLSVVAPSLSSRPEPTYMSFDRALQALELAKPSGFGFSGASFGTQCVFVFCWIPLTFGGETSGVPLPWGIL